MTDKPPVFETVAQALKALELDKLATVYFRKGQVFVATAFGTGTFSYGRWRREGGRCASEIVELLEKRSI